MNELKVIDERVLFEKDFKIYGTWDKPLFLAKDVAEWIEHSNPRMMLQKIDEDEKVVSNVYTLGGVQESWFLTEDGLYEVLMQSRKPIAKEFKKKVKEILKDVRKNGVYMTDNLLEKTLDNPDFMIDLLTKYKEEKVARQQEEVKRIEAEKKNAILMHVNKLYTATEIAKELGMKSASKLNQELHDKKIQYQSNGTWVLYSKYADMGLVSIKQNVLDSGKVIYDRKWTQEGRKFLLGLYEMEVA